MAGAVDVCVATFQRPELLAQLLASLAQQRLQHDTLRIIVIDNDADGSARATVEAFAPTAPVVEVVYDIEPVQSIALARNRALLHLRGEWFAFVDDDQTVASDWLERLLACMRRFDCDAVFGPVASALPANAPGWAAPCFMRPQRPTGTPVRHGGAGNVLVRRTGIGAARFDPAFGLSGGEDTNLFFRMYQRGCSMVWCAEALAVESVPAARLSLAWIRRRGFRDGQNYARIFMRSRSRWHKAGWFVKKVAQLVGGVVLAPLLWCLSKRRYVILTVRLAAASGQLSTVFSGKYLEEYRLPARH
jgi:succinoglycan biosynthesis protein ExoM